MKTLNLMDRMDLDNKFSKILQPAILVIGWIFPMVGKLLKGVPTKTRGITDGKAITAKAVWLLGCVVYGLTNWSRNHASSSALGQLGLAHVLPYQGHIQNICF